VHAYWRQRTNEAEKFQNDNVYKEGLHIAFGIHYNLVCVVRKVITSATARRVKNMNTRQTSTYDLVVSSFLYIFLTKFLNGVT
jgi:hypothetical protein